MTFSMKYQFEFQMRNFIFLEHKSRRSSDFQIQMMKYKQVIHKWQKKEFGRMYSIIPVLFYQGLDNWDPEKELEEERKLYNPILSENRQDILIFDLRKIDLLNVFGSLEMKAGMLLLKIIRYPWVEFIEGWSKVREILNSMEKTKRIDLEEEMLDYIFRSRTEENDFLEEAIMGKKVLTAYERALEEGELKKALETARKMLEKGFSISEIQDITGLMDDQLKENGIL